MYSAASSWTDMGRRLAPSWHVWRKHDPPPPPPPPERARQPKQTDSARRQRPVCGDSRARGQKQQTNIRMLQVAATHATTGTTLLKKNTFVRKAHAPNHPQSSWSLRAAPISRCPRARPGPAARRLTARRRGRSARRPPCPPSSCARRRGCGSGGSRGRRRASAPDGQPGPRIAPGARVGRGSCEATSSGVESDRAHRHRVVARLEMELGRQLGGAVEVEGGCLHPRVVRVARVVHICAAPRERAWAHA